MTMGGGWGVVTTDECIESGLKVPPLSEDLISEIDKILPPYWSRTNPIDMVGEFDPTIPFKVVEALSKWDGCDAIIHLGAVGKGYIVKNMIAGMMKTNPDFPREITEEASQRLQESEHVFFEHTVRLMEKYSKPILGVMLIDDETSRFLTDIPGSRFKALSFLTPERAVRALAKMSEYNDWLVKNR